MTDLAGLFTPFASVQGWLTLLILFLLELVLGVDNLVFIAITAARLPAAEQHLGRRLGLALALVMRIILLCLAFLLIHLTTPLFRLPWTIPGTNPNFTAKDLILLAGGIYLICKGTHELTQKISLKAEKIQLNLPRSSQRGHITLTQAVLTIVAMDAIFSVDSVVTAVGLSGELLVMILAVILAVLLMIIFADPVANFINANPEIKILALVFILAVGLKLVATAFGLDIVVAGTEVDVLDLMLYFGMFLALLITLLQMVYRRRLEKLAVEYPDIDKLDGLDKPDKPGKPDKPDKPGKPDKLDK